MDKSSCIILVLAGKNTGPSFGYPLLGKEFQQIGFHVEYVEANSDSLVEIFKRIFLEYRVKFVLSHNHLCIDLKIEGQYFYDYFNTVYLTLTDTPLCRFGLTMDSGNNVGFLIGDNRFKSIMSSVGKADKIFEWYGYNNFYEEKPVKSISSRKIDVLVPARIGDSVGRIKKYSWIKKRFAYYMQFRYFNHKNEFQLDELIKRDLSDYPFYFKKLAKSILIPSNENWWFLWDITHLIRTKRRQHVVNELLKLDGNIKVTIITDKQNVEELKKQSNGRFEVLPFLPWPEVIALMRNTKIVINTLPFHAQAHHERIATSQYCGAAVFSDINNYLKSKFNDLENIYFYNFTKGDLSTKLTNALSDISKISEVAKNGRRIVLSQDMPSNRAAYIIEIAELLSRDLKSIANETKK